MRAREYKDAFIHMMAQGYTVEDALTGTMLAFVEEYNDIVRNDSGIVVHNALRQQNDKWKAFARSLPNYNIREDGFLASLQAVKPKLYEAYVNMEAILKEMRREKSHGNL